MPTCKTVGETGVDSKSNKGVGGGSFFQEICGIRRKTRSSRSASHSRRSLHIFRAARREIPCDLRQDAHAQRTPPGVAGELVLACILSTLRLVFLPENVCRRSSIRCLALWPRQDSRHWYFQRRISRHQRDLCKGVVCAERVAERSQCRRGGFGGD